MPELTRMEQQARFSGRANFRDTIRMEAATNQVLFLHDTVRTRYHPVLSSFKSTYSPSLVGDRLFVFSNPFIVF